MPWSTRELAELAGTTVNTVRHYHRVGLLDEPERRDNGYKQYGVRHLVSLLRIRRLADLGVPLAQIGDVAEGGEGRTEALRALDAELGESMARLEEARRQIAAILQGDAPAHGPAGFESVSPRLSEADSSMVHIYTQLYDEEALADVRRMAADDLDGLVPDIDRLPADADEETRQALAERLAKTLARNVVDYPWLTDPAAHLSKSGRVTAETFVEAVRELYNPAQLDVLVRADALAGERPNEWSNGAPIAIDMSTMSRAALFRPLAVQSSAPAAHRTSLRGAGRFASRGQDRALPDRIMRTRIAATRSGISDMSKPPRVARTVDGRFRRERSLCHNSAI